MINAINNEKDWHNDNTSVRVIHEGILFTPSYNKTIEVRLHNNLIASINNNQITISSCGWNTSTTKSRLNALLREFANTSIYQKNRVWYVENPWFSITGPVEFKDNMVIGMN